MNYPLNTLTTMVAARSGALPDWLWRLNQGAAPDDSLSLRDLVESIAAEEAIALTLEADASTLDCLRDGTAAILPTLDWGDEYIVEGQLPADCLRLARFRLKGWKRAISGEAFVAAGSSLRPADLPTNRPTSPSVDLPMPRPGERWRHLRRGMPQFALGAEAKGPGDCDRCFRCSPRGDGAIAEALYAPKPYLEHGYLCDLSPALLLPLAERIATRLRD